MCLFGDNHEKVSITQRQKRRQRQIPHDTTTSSSPRLSANNFSDTEEPARPAAEPSEQTNGSRRSERAGHKYDQSRVEGNAKALFGNVFAETINYNGSHQGGQSLGDKSWTNLMNALKFDQMDLRRAVIEPAHARTCRWIFDTPEYARWRNTSLLHSHRGVLWIKGKPGSGKSTIMKCILESTSDNMSAYKVLSFFYNARGGALERSVEGMYRSLIYQVLRHMSKMPKRYTSKMPNSIALLLSVSQDQEWAVETLKDIFLSALLSLKGERWVCFIDALDEGIDQDDIRDMVTFFGRVTTSAKRRSVVFDACFASRHYPRITIPSCEAIIVEDQEEHQKDIRRYIGETLTSDQGETRIDLINTLSSLPAGLTEVIDGIIAEGASDECLLPTLQWVLMANGRVRVEELYFAIRLSVGKLTSPAWDHDEYDAETMQRYILQSSKGLVDFVEGLEDRANTAYGARTMFVQLIHESVREHLLTGGLQALDSTLSVNVETACHAKLAQHCQDYVRLNPAQYLSPPLPHEKVQEFWRSSLLKIYKERHLVGAVAPMIDANAVAFFVDSDLDVRCGGQFGSLLGAAARLGDMEIVQLVLDIGADVNTDGGLDGSPLTSAAHGGHLDVVRLLLERKAYVNIKGGIFGTPLTSATDIGNLDMAKLLLERGADVNMQDGHGATPLIGVSRSGWVQFVQLLLDHGADIHHRSKHHGTALEAARRNGHQEVANLLELASTKRDNNNIAEQ
ncbi:hypothetical protein Q7P37_005197 [Cladosporium fusiforme]